MTTMPQMQRPQKVKMFGNSNVAGLERDINSWLRSTSPSPLVREVEISGWGGAGEYTVVALVLYE